VRWFDQEDIMSVVDRDPSPSTDSAELQRRFGFTRKEAQVAALIALGRTNVGIARELFVRPHTARHHSEHLRQKLGVHSRTEAASRILRSS
jgi:DNA-binding NarL/FixJ family response regulator